MVYLLKMVIFYGYVSHNQMVCMAQAMFDSHLGILFRSRDHCEIAPRISPVNSTGNEISSHLIMK